MTLTLTLPPDTEAQILEDARQAGMTLKECALGQSAEDVSREAIYSCDE